MRAAIHQPHYFAWTGYLNKIASVDKFIFMDNVQIADSSYMYRHQLMTNNGGQKYITIPFEKNDYKSKKYKDICINNNINWQEQHSRFIFENYRKSKYYSEVFDLISPIFKKEYHYLCDVCIETTLILTKMFGIKTEIIKQSDLHYDESSKKNELVLELCLAVNASEYLSGAGAKKYMDVLSFENTGVWVKFQNYVQPEYSQISSNVFVRGLSSLDMLFSIGIEESNKLFWENVL